MSTYEHIARDSADEFEAQFDHGVKSWTVSSSSGEVAAFRQYGGRPEKTLSVLGERFEITTRRFRFGGTLWSNGQEVATGTRSILSGRIQLRTVTKAYSVRRKLIELWRDYRVFRDGTKIAEFRKKFRGSWTIRRSGEIDLHLLVFVLWLVLAEISEEGS